MFIRTSRPVGRIQPGMDSTPKFEPADAIALLIRTPAALSSLLRGLPELWIRQTEGPDTWTVYDTIGHMVVIERTDWMPRVRSILENAAAGNNSPKTFGPVDRFAQLKLPNDRPLDQLLDEFATLRSANLRELQSLNIQPKDLRQQGNHPAFGAVTLAELLATWAVHDLTHLHQITRVMAHQYRAAVGPWSAYLGVLQCNGHSAP